MLSATSSRGVASPRCQITNGGSSSSVNARGWLRSSRQMMRTPPPAHCATSAATRSAARGSQIAPRARCDTVDTLQLTLIDQRKLGRIVHRRQQRSADSGPKPGTKARYATPSVYPPHASPLSEWVSMDSMASAQVAVVAETVAREAVALHPARDDTRRLYERFRAPHPLAGRRSACSISAVYRPADPRR